MLITKDLVNFDVENNELTVLARNLYEALGSNSRYNDWFAHITKYGFTKNVDYYVFTQNDEDKNKGRPRIEHQITLDMAKEICMLTRNEQGRAVRKYFIDVEKQWNSPDKVMARGLIIADKKIGALTEENQLLKNEVAQKTQLISELQPKSDYCDKVLQSTDLLTTTQIAKDYGYSAREFNQILHKLGIQFKQSRQWMLYAKYQNLGYTQSFTFQIDTQYGKETVVETKWTQKGKMFLYEILKEHGIVPVWERDNITTKKVGYFGSAPS